MLYYDYHNAPNARVPRMFAAEKGLDLPKQHVDVPGGENHRAPYSTTINRTGQVPALVLDDGSVIREVLAICEYLEELQPAPALIGSTPAERAETRLWTRWIDLKYVERMTEACIVREGPIREHYAKHNYKTLLPAPMSAVCAEMAHEKLDWFNHEMTGRRFVCGDRFTLADIHLHVFLAFFDKIGLGYPRTLSWVDQHYRSVGSRPSARV